MKIEEMMCSKIHIFLFIKCVTDYTLTIIQQGKGEGIMSLNHMIDHTMLKADASKETIIRYCNEAKEQYQTKLLWQVG